MGLRLKHGAEQRRHLMDEIRFFVTKSEVEQRLRLNKHVTSLEDFWRYRLGSGAVRVLLCLNESVVFPFRKCPPDVDEFWQVLQ